MNVRRLLYLAAFTAASLSARTLQAQTDIIRGRVIGPDSLPIPGVTVTVTSISGNVSRPGKSDKKGNFSISFPNGDGDYMVTFSAMGYAAKRFEVKRTADQEVLLADAKLARSAVTLDAVKVQQERNKPNRGDAGSTDISGSEQRLGAGLSSDLMGDLAAMAGSLPGVTYIPPSANDPGGFSVFGLDPSQNLTTLNGNTFGGNGIPRDAGASASLSTGAYDVARGGFSGGSLNITTGSGSNYIFRNMSLVSSPQTAAWTDATGRASGALSTANSLGGRVSGPISFGKSFYTFSYQFDRNQRDLHDLLNTDALGLAAQGIAMDSVNSLKTLFTGAKIPFTAGGVPTDNLNDSGSILGSFDFTPPTSTTGASYQLSYSGQASRRAPSFMSALDLPAHSGKSDSWNFGIGGKHNAYFGFGVLTETRVNFSAQHSDATPYVNLPSGSVRVTSDLGDVAPVVKNVGFGGSPSRSKSYSTSESFMNTMSWFSENNKHRLKLTSELRYDYTSSEAFSNQLGTFSYASLADFRTNTPSSFSRQLTPRDRSLGNIVAGASLGDSYRPNNDLQVQYGVRLDANHFTTLPTYNPAVTTAFGGVHNDRVPTPIYLSPRIGFTRTLGVAPQVVTFDGAARPPRVVISGGIGVFQNAANTGQLGQAYDNNGLPSGVQQLTCIGASAPIPDWNAFADTSTVPSVCAGAPTVFASSAPNVTLFSKDYASPRRLSGNFSWRGVTLGNRFSTSINTTLNYSTNQLNTYDLNFNPTSRFTLDGEGNRPVYVDSTSIVQSTGLPGLDSRTNTAFNHVSEMRSDLKSRNAQVQIGIRPWNSTYSVGWSATYVLATTRDQVGGFASTNGDPTGLTGWGRASSDSRHQIQLSLNYLAFSAVRITWNQQFRSGTPYTPMVSGDINGDGYGNDRAFIFNPATTADPTLKAAMQSLLDNGSDGARSCLKSQLGSIAGRNTCQGPWTTGASLRLQFDPVLTHMPNRATVYFDVTNPLGAADAIMHGENNLHGWGQTLSPDAALLFVRGFDRPTNTFKYEVNQRFGATSLQQSAFRTPVQVRLSVNVDIGPTRERQRLTQQLDRGRSIVGAKFPEAMFKSMGAQGEGVNAMAMILRNADTLELTRVQADSIAAINRWFTIHVDSIWTPIAKYLAELPEKYDQDAAYEQYKHGRQAAIDLMIKAAPTVKSLLTPTQLRNAGPFVAMYLDPKYLYTIRSSSSAPLSYAMEQALGGGSGFGVGERALVGGGGPGILIIR